MNRLLQVNSHLTNPGAADVRTKNDGDVVIIASYRTPIAKGGKGSFKDMNSDELLYKFTKEFIKKLPPQFDLRKIEDVVIGNVLNHGAGAIEHRAALLSAGLDSSIPFMAINRQCSSGLMAINDIANKIISGQIDCGLAGGVESMSSNYGPKAVPKLSHDIKQDSQGSKCLIPMGITNENVSKNFQISRQKQDNFAALSYQKAERAVKQNLFKDEILPIEITQNQEEEDDDDEDDDEKGEGTSNGKHEVKKILVSKDEGPRPNVTSESLSKLKSSFNGTTHAGNASQISDGASLCLLCTRKMANELNLPILGKYVATSVVGVPPEIMGVGPAYAIPSLLKKIGLCKNDITFFEINEAFAGQCIYCIEKLGLDLNKVNPRGGAIALGHPLGCTGARQVATLMRELKEGEFGVVSMCIGTGMGAASLFIKE